MAEELLAYLKAEFKRYDADHQKRVLGYTKSYKQFRGLVDASKSTTKSRLFIQRTKVACIAGVANVADILFPSDDFFDVLGRNDPDTAKAETTKKYLRWALKNGRFFRESVLYILQAAVYGVAFGKVVPYSVTELETRKVQQFLGGGAIPGAPMVGYDTNYTKKTVRLAKLESIDVFDVWTDPSGTGVDRDKSAGLFHRVRRTIGYLKAREADGIYKNTVDIEELLRKRKTGKSRFEKDERRSAMGLPEVQLDPEEIILFEFSGRIPAAIAKTYKGLEVPDGEFETEIIATVDEDFTICLRAERNHMPNQMRMWVSDVWEPTTEKSVNGRGIPENVRGSQQALNVTVNLRLDNKAWAIAAPLVVNLDKLESPATDLVARVNWVIRGRGAAPSEIAQFTSIPDVTSGSTLEAQEFERHIDEESGMNKAVQATQSTGSNRTFGGISLAYSAAARPVRLVAKGFEDNLISQGLKKIFAVLVEYLDDDVAVRVTDDPRSPEYLRCSPMDLALDVDFVASGSFALAQRDQIVQAMGSFFDSLSKLPQLTQLPNWNWKYMVQKLYEAMGLTDFNKVWTDNPAMPAGVPGASPAGPMPAGGMPPELMAMLGQGGAGEAGQGGGAGAGVPPEVAGGNGAVELLAALGRMAGGGGG